MKFLVALLLAQSVAQPLTPTTGVQRTELFSTSALTYYAGTSGNDGSSCTSSGTACATINGALAKIPLNPRHDWIVNVGAGNFSGFIVPAKVTSGSGVNGLIQGTCGASTLASGLQSGTLTSAVASSGSTYGTATRTAAGWTVNDLRGRFISITGGTGSGQSRVIISNTATEISVSTWGTTPDSTSTFEIIEPLTVINSPVTFATGAGTNVSAGFIVEDVGYHPGGSYRMRIDCIRVSTATGFQFQLGGGDIEMRSVWFTPTTTSAGRMTGFGRTTFNNFYVSLPASGAFWSTLGYYNVQSLQQGLIMGGATQMQFGGGELTLFDRMTMSGASTSALAWGTVGDAQITNSNISATGTCINNASGYHSGSGWAVFITGSVLSSCGTAINSTGNRSFVDLNLVSGTGSTTVNLLSKGGNIRYRSNSTVTGTTEVSLDGVTTDDIADMRAASPRLLTNTYGSIIYE